MSTRRVYVVTYVHSQWKNHQNSPFASASITYADPSAAHEGATRLKNQGAHNVTITPKDIPSENGEKYEY